MKLPNEPGRRFPGSGGNEGLPEIIDYDSRRTGNRSLDAGSTPAYSIFCGKEGPTKWEDALSPGRRLRTKFVLECVCSMTCGKEEYLYVIRRTKRSGN